MPVTTHAVSPGERPMNDSSSHPNYMDVLIHFRGRVKETIEIPPEKLDLYGLLRSVLADANVPKSMPANLARTCDDLVEVRHLVETIDRGLVDTKGATYGLSYALEAQQAIKEHQDRDPVTLVAVGCSSSKDPADDPLPAAERYAGGYWKNKREYYEAVGDEGRIISAEHGLLDPSEYIDYYEKHITDLDGIPVDHDGRLPSGDDVSTLVDLWAYNVHNALAHWIDDASSGVDPRDVQLEILLGKPYHNRLRDRGVFDALRARGTLDISFPFREEVDYSNGGGIGNQRSWMVDKVAAARESEVITDA